MKFTWRIILFLTTTPVLSLEFPLLIIGLQVVNDSFTDVWDIFKIFIVGLNIEEWIIDIAFLFKFWTGSSLVTFSGLHVLGTRTISNWCYWCRCWSFPMRGSSVLCNNVILNIPCTLNRSEFTINDTAERIRLWLYVPVTVSDFSGCILSNVK